MVSAYTNVIDPATQAASVAIIRRDADNALIPADPANADWRAYQAWRAAGNMPNDATPAMSHATS